tara:strand:- start:2963 stop:3211 length:249 start_codon:yes stop_codon:yes gene_type:complete
LRWYGFYFQDFILPLKNGFEDWLYGLILYLIGIIWVVPFVLSKTITAPHSCPALTPESKYKWPRLFYFSFGLIISLSDSLVP